MAEDVRPEDLTALCVEHELDPIARVAERTRLADPADVVAADLDLVSLRERAPASPGSVKIARGSQVPPTSPLSKSATRAPRRRAAETPAQPPMPQPITATS